MFLRSDTAAYQHDLVRYYAEWKNERFRVIEFGISPDVTPGFKKAAADVEQAD